MKKALLIVLAIVAGCFILGNLETISSIWDATQRGATMPLVLAVVIMLARHVVQAISYKAAFEAVDFSGPKLWDYIVLIFSLVFINTFNCMNTVENYDQLDGDRQTGLRTIINPISAVCSNYANKAIRETADAHGYAVVDAYSWIEKRAYRFSYPTLPRMNLTEEGQALIARVLDQAVSGYALGDVNGDSAIDAKDASDILTHSAEMGVGHAPILTGDDQKAADVNMDGAVNASDASTILVYSTSAGVGTAPTFAELAKQ